MAGKNPFPFQKKGSSPAGDARRKTMNKGKLPGLDKLPKGENPKDSPASERAERLKGDNPKDSPAKEMAERLKGIKT